MTQRYDNIDGLRALAALLVASFHFGHPSSAEMLRFATLIPWWPFGGEAVYLFFIVSGYCIAMTAERSPTPYEFLIRRVSRLLPAFTAGVIITAVFMSFASGGASKFGYWNALLNAAWVPLFVRTVPLVDPVYWSLLIEVKFYFIFWLLLAASGNSVRWAAIGFAVLTVLGTMLFAFGIGNSVNVPIYRFKGVAQGLLLFPASAFFLFGLSLYLARGKWGVPTLAGLLAVLATWLCAPTTFWQFAKPSQESFVATVALIVFAGLVLPNTNIRLPRPITYIGLVSYPFYLVHQNIGLTIIRELAPIIPSPHIRTALVTALMIGLAAAISVLIERPFRAPVEKALRWPATLWARRPDLPARQPESLAPGAPARSQQ